MNHVKRRGAAASLRGHTVQQLDCAKTAALTLYLMGGTEGASPLA